jgi:hypothetical protein
MPRRTDIAGIHPHRRVGGPLLHKRFEAKSSGGLVDVHSLRASSSKSGGCQFPPLSSRGCALLGRSHAENLSNRHDCVDTADARALASRWCSSRTLMSFVKLARSSHNQKLVVPELVNIHMEPQHGPAPRMRPCGPRYWLRVPWRFAPLALLREPLRPHGLVPPKRTVC